MARTGQASRGNVASARRTLAVLEALADGGVLGTNELARRLDLPPSTVSRLLGSLVDAELVEFVEDTRRYRLGLRLVHLGNAVLARLDVRDVARPHLEELVQEVGETATLSVPGGGSDAITVDFVPTDRYVQGVTRLGRPSIGHATAAGKTMLAFAGGPLPEPPLQRFTRHTIADVEELQLELARIRRQGWADAYEEREPELNAIAAPIFNSRDRLEAVVALQGPVPRFGRAAAKQALPRLLERAAAISRELGSRRGDTAAG